MGFLLRALEDPAGLRRHTSDKQDVGFIDRRDELTAKTLMSRARVDEFDSERVLGHAVRGVAGTYGHHDHREAKGAALDRLAAEVRRIVDPPPEDKVIQMGAAE